MPARPAEMPIDRFAELKACQPVSWGAAPFERITETFVDIHDRLIARLAPRPGETSLDVATRTGPLALRAARAGATVVGVHLAPSLLATARQLAAAGGLAIQFEVGDCERLAYPVAGFAVVASSFGTIFAPDHAAFAAELARVCRPRREARSRQLAAGRRRGPDGRGRHVLPAESAGSGGWERSRLGDAFELAFVAGDSPQIAPAAEAVSNLYVSSAGPVKALAGTLPLDRQDALRPAFVSLVDAHRGDGGIRFPREYLLVLGRRR
jgi:hypothetical protein